MPTQRKRPQDLTGRQTEVLARQRDEDTSRAAEISMATAAAEREELQHSVIDLTAKAPEDIRPTGPVEVASPTRRVRISEDLEDTIFGHGNMYTLKAGQQYVLPREFADHLDRLGFVHH